MFPSTRWSLVLAANGAETESAARALDDLCRIYRPAVVAFARRALGSWEEAEDATQEFFADFLARRRLEAAHPAGGRFRTFVLTHFRLVLSDRRKRSEAAKRGGKRPALSLEALPPGEEPGESPESGWLDAHWAAQVVWEALRRLEAEQGDGSGGIPFTVMRAYLPGFQSGEAAPYEEVAHRYHLSPGALRVRVSRLRQRFGEQINAVLADTVGEAADVDSEREALVAAAASPDFGRWMRRRLADSGPGAVTSPGDFPFSIG